MNIQRLDELVAALEELKATLEECARRRAEAFEELEVAISKAMHPAGRGQDA